MSNSFVKLLVSQLFANLADIFFRVTIIANIYIISKSVIATSLVPILIGISSFVASLLVPLVTKRLALNRVLSLSQFGKTILLAILVGMFTVMQSVAPLVTYLFVVAISILDGFAAPVSYAIVPRYATDLGKANSALSMTGEAVQLIGWGLGGLLFATIGLLPTTCINLVLYIISSFLMLFLPNAEVEVLESETNLEILLKGWKLVARNPRLRLFVSANLLEIFSNTIWVSSIILVFVTELLNKTESYWGYSNTAYSIGIIISGLIAFRLSEKFLAAKWEPQLFTPNLKTIQNPCLSLDPGWFLFSPNGCFLLDKKEFPLYGISVEKNTKRKETHMNSLPNHHFQNKSFYQLSFDGGHLTQYGGLIFFQELFSQLKLKERISKYLVTNDQRRYCRYSDSDILVQFLFQLLTGYGTDYACKELSADAYFPKLLEGGQLASQPTLSRFLSRTDEETVHSLRCLNLELVEFFLQFHQLNQLIVDIDSTHFTTYGKQEGVAYNAHYRAHGYHPLYAFEGKTGYCFNAQLRPGNRYCSEEADSFITPVLERFNQLLFRMDSGFATPKLYDLIEKTGQYYLIKLKKNTVLSRLGDLSLPCPQDEDLTILPHSAYSETLYQAGSWSHKRRVCQFSERKEGNLFYDVISLVTNMTSGTSQDQFQLYRGRGQAENFIKEMKEGFFGDKTDSSTLIKNEVRMMMSCIAYNLYLFLKHLAGGDFQTLTIKRFRHLFLHVVGKCVRTGRKQLLKLSSLYAYSELFSALYSRIRKVNLNLPVPYEPPRRKASLMMH